MVVGARLDDEPIGTPQTITITDDEERLTARFLDGSADTHQGSGARSRSRSTSAPRSAPTKRPCGRPGRSPAARSRACNSVMRTPPDGRSRSAPSPTGTWSWFCPRPPGAWVTTRSAPPATPKSRSRRGWSAGLTARRTPPARRPACRRTPKPAPSSCPGTRRPTTAACPSSNTSTGRRWAPPAPARGPIFPTAARGRATGAATGSPASPGGCRTPSRCGR